MAYLPVNARSECVAPADDSLGGVVETMRMFQAACPASQRPAFRPTRGSGLGGVIETIGATGGGITAGGGGGGVGLAPPRAPCVAVVTASCAACAGAAVCGVCGACGACATNEVAIRTTAAEPASSVPVIHSTFFIRDSPVQLFNCRPMPASCA